MNLAKLTEQNRDAMAIYQEATRILTLPLPERKPQIQQHPQRDRLAKEITRIWNLRRERGAA